MCGLFFFEQKTAYEMRISDWSADVCSSDLDATYVADGGATTKAARHPIVGATRVSRFMAYVYGRRARSKSAERIELNGEPAIAIYFRGKLDSVLFIEPGPDDRATTIYALRNPEKLRSEEHTSELQSLMRISYAVFCLKKKNNYKEHTTTQESCT